MPVWATSKTEYRQPASLCPARVLEGGGMRLTDTFLRNLKNTSKAQKHSDGGGLYLFISLSGGKLWRRVESIDIFI
jgi:hypothetical protein